MAKRAIPAVPKDSAGVRRAFEEAVKENIETFTGLRGGKIKPLESNATTAELIAKINAVIDRLQ